MKHVLSRFLTGCALVILAGCAAVAPSSADPRQQVVDATFKSAATLDATITSARSAVQSGALKGKDAANVLRSLEASLASIKAAQASLVLAPAVPAVPASGVKP